MEYHTLRRNLELFSSALSSADESATRGAISIIKDRVRQYIENSLQSKIAIDQIEKDLQSLCDQVVIPTFLWEWTTQEITNAKESVGNEICVSPQMPLVVRPVTPEYSLFCKNTLHHASLCCDAINTTNPANAPTYFQSKNPHHNFTEVSFSQNRGSITPYLIAVQQEILYIAFQGTFLLSDWKNVGSFDEGAYRLLQTVSSLQHYVLYIH